MIKLKLQRTLFFSTRPFTTHIREQVSASLAKARTFVFKVKLLREKMFECFCLDKQRSRQNADWCLCVFFVEENVLKWTNHSVQRSLFFWKVLEVKLFKQTSYTSVQWMTWQKLNYKFTTELNLRLKTRPVNWVIVVICKRCNGTKPLEWYKVKKKLQNSHSV